MTDLQIIGLIVWAVGVVAILALYSKGYFDR